VLDDLDEHLLAEKATPRPTTAVLDLDDALDGEDAFGAQDDTIEQPVDPADPADPDTR
jgi:hypothetical protein